MVTTATKDHLTSLAPELQHMIFDHLLPSHEPDKAFESEQSKAGKNEKKPNTHPLDYLAATCKALRDEVNEWALHFLAQHRDITKYREYKDKNRQRRRDFLRGRFGILTWSEKHCVFCSNKSSRSAILMNGLRCCAKCDKEQWPDKITKTEAKMKYGLKDEHLLPSATLSPTAVRMLKDYPGLPAVRYGTYITSNVPTTMFLRKDVEALAKLAYGDLKAHLARREADRNDRRKKAKETKARKDAEAEKLKKMEAEAEALHKARMQREDHAELMWSYRHKHYSITTYGIEDGPVTPPSLPASPQLEGAGGKKHRKTLSIDSDAANEGRVISSPPNPRKIAQPPISPRIAGVNRATDYAAWNDLPSMFGFDPAEWDAIVAEQCPPTPPQAAINAKSQFDVLESFGKGKNVAGKELDVADVYGKWL